MPMPENLKMFIIYHRSIGFLYVEGVPTTNPAIQRQISGILILKE